MVPVETRVADLFENEFVEAHTDCVLIELQFVVLAYVYVLPRALERSEEHHEPGGD